MKALAATQNAVRHEILSVRVRVCRLPNAGAWYPRARKMSRMTSVASIPASGELNRAVNQTAAIAVDEPLCRYIDIGINLADPVFRGIYHGSKRHQDDLDRVIDRARQVGCRKVVVTGSDDQSTHMALDLSRRYHLVESRLTRGLRRNATPPPAGTVYATAGIHPCSSSIFGTPGPDGKPDERATATALEILKTVVAGAGSSLVALGEFGLDYDRLQHCSRQVQLHSFAAQLELAAQPTTPQLPLFLHSRAAHADFVGLLRARFGPDLGRLVRGGVVHSFTGSLAEMRELVGLGLDIGINGCSLKTEENVAVVRELPLSRLLLETDGPWCEMRPSHAAWSYLGPAAQPRFPSAKKERWVEGAMVKGRNEPCMIERVAAAVAAIKGVEIAVVSEAAWQNTVRLFGLEE